MPRKINSFYLILQLILKIIVLCHNLLRIREKQKIMKILGIGNALVDILIQLQDDELLKKFKLPKGSMTLVDEDMSHLILKEASGLPQKKASGGSAANTIYGLASLGLETAFIGKISDDESGRFFRNDIIINNICPFLFQSLTNTGKAITLITPDSERTFATYLGASIELSANDLKAEIFKGYDLFYVEGYIILNRELISKALKLASMAGLTIAMDLASYNVVRENREFLYDLLKKYVNIVFANEKEAKELTGLEPYQAAEVLSEFCNKVIVKTGTKGSIVRYKKETIKIEPVKSNPVDTTGAGDLYASGFIYGLSRGASPHTCGLLGSVLAGKVIENIGARMNEPTWKALRKYLNDEIISL